MTDIIGENASFATLYFTDIPVISNGNGEYRHENRDFAAYVSNLFDKSKTEIIDNRGVERVVLPEVIQSYNYDLKSKITPKVYTCSSRIVIVVDENLNSQKSLSVCEIGDLINLMKNSSEKRHDICDDIYNRIHHANCTRDSQRKYFCDINTLETNRDNDAIIDEIVVKMEEYQHQSGKTSELEDIYSILSSTGTDHIEDISAIHNNGERIPLRCSNIDNGSNSRVITALTVSHGASVVVDSLVKEYLTQVP